MIRSAQIETQLQAMAAASDRANRPTTLIVAGAGVLAIAAIFALWSGVRFMNARKRLDSEMYARSTVSNLLSVIAGRKQEAPDLDALFPEMPFLETNIDEMTLKVYGITPEQKGSVPVAVRRKDGPRPLTGTPGVGKSSVDVTFNAQPLDKIFGLVDAVQENPYLRTTFVSSITLTPITTGWNATIRFGVYEKTK